MAVIGKKPYIFHLTEDNVEYVKSFLEVTRNKGGLSGFVDAYFATVSKTLRSSNYVAGKKISLKQLLKIGFEGIKAEVL